LASSQIPKAGLGVFACEDIPAGTCIDEYTGEVLSSNRVSNYALEVRPDCFIDACELPRCYMAMINDCSYIARRVIRRKKRWVTITPKAYHDLYGRQLLINCEFVVNKASGRAFIHSLVDIPAGAELFIDYGPDYWKDR
jgi:SET domain-containing protein